MQLKRTHLDPILKQLQGSDGSKISFDDILRVYQQIRDDYDASAVGAKDAIAEAFADFHPVRNYLIYFTFLSNIFQQWQPPFVLSLSNANETLKKTSE